jgi:hypothetical protein
VLKLYEEIIFMDNFIEFTPKYSTKFQAKHLDQLYFQWSGTNEDGDFVMYNNIAEVIICEDNGNMFIEWNGTRYNAYEFLHCDHLDGNFSMDSISVYRNGIKIY